MKIGTHNSMTYLPPKKWYLYPFKFIAKCQRVDIEEQHKLGARMFDIRIAYDKEGNPEFRHGLMRYKGNVEDIFKLLSDRKGWKSCVRLLLEVKNNKDLARQESLFKRDCAIWESTYRICFFCGRRKFDWKVVYQFKAQEPELVQMVSSMTGTVLDDWYPYLYAKSHNKENYSNRDKSKWTLFDFIDIR